MKKYITISLFTVLVSSCSLFLPRQAIQPGMTESKFLRMNRGAVVSSIDGTSKTYRVTRDDRFYVLATFEDGILTNVEEKELTPRWPVTVPQN